MLADYQDIRTRIPEEPKWFDSNGVPRYDHFRPQDVPDIYANEVVLYRINCQCCGKPFDVSSQHGPTDLYRALPSPLCDQIQERSLHYGDPPIHECTGDTMNCLDIRVLEYWQRDRLDWIRVGALETPLQDAEEAED